MFYTTGHLREPLLINLFLRWLISWHIPDVPPDLHYKFSQQTLREGGWATLCITLQDIRIHNTDERLIVWKVKGPFSGPSLSLKCVASGNPPPTISWFLDGQVISVTDPRQSFTRLNTFVDRWDTRERLLTHCNFAIVEGQIESLVFSMCSEYTHQSHLPVHIILSECWINEAANLKCIGFKLKWKASSCSVGVSP